MSNKDAQGFIHSSHQNLQGWSHYSPAGKFAPLPDCSLRKKVLPHIHSECFLFQSTWANNRPKQQNEMETIYSSPWVKSPLQGIVIPMALWALYHWPPIGAKGRAGHQLATCKFHLFLNIFFQGWEEDRTGRSTVLYTHTETISSCQQHFLICEKRSRKDKVNAGSLSEFIRHFAIHPNFISCFKFP